MKKRIKIIILLIIIGFVSGFFTKNYIDKIQVIKENEKQTSLSKLMTKKEIEQLKDKIAKDEADYGDNYEEFKTAYPYIFTRDPDKIYFKPSKVGAFYMFEKSDENYKHLLEVIEDRMHYSVIDDYNLNCFTPVSINNMMTSGENYIILDYNNENSSEYNRNIIFRFQENTRLYRLVTYLSYYKQPIKRNDLEKNEFADDTNMTGYQYMTYPEGN